jgi:GT2 family glycosyltransferase
MQTELPIIIVNYNGLDDTKACIESIANADFTNYTIYLVDNNSDLTEQAQLKEIYQHNPKIHFIQNNTNIGFGAAHNEVIEKHIKDKSWNYVALINNDTIVERACFEKALECIYEHNIDVLSMKMLDYNQQSLMDSAGHRILSNGEILPVGHGEKQQDYISVMENIGSSGGACIYSRRCLEDIGFFDPYFFVGYEDAELGLRAFIAGYKCKYCPHAIVYHKGGQSIKKIFNTDYAIKTFKNIRYTNYKLLPWSLLLLFAPLRLLRLVLILVVSLLSLKWPVAKVAFTSFVEFYFSDFTKALKTRKTFYSKRSTISTLRILKTMNSTLIHDIENFYSIFVKKKSTAIDDYR